MIYFNFGCDTSYFESSGKDTFRVSSKLEEFVHSKEESWGAHDNMPVTRNGIERAKVPGMGYSTVSFRPKGCLWVHGIQQYFNGLRSLVLGVGRFLGQPGFGLFERFGVLNKASFQELPTIYTLSGTGELNGLD